VIRKLVEDAQMRAGRREHGVSVLRHRDGVACAVRDASHQDE
jgi:hypothetical protein